MVEGVQQGPVLVGTFFRSQGDGDGSQPGQAVVRCRFRGALRWLSDRFPFGVGGDGQTAHKGAHGPGTQPGA